MGNDYITEIYISHTPSAIASLQFKYANQGKHVLSDLLGTSDGLKFNAVLLQISEYITGVKGMLDPVNGIISLTFITSKSKFGPFGLNCDISGDGFAAAGSGSGCPYVPFDLQFGYRFGGFNGRTKNGRVTSIGGYFKTS
ncbi:hypothetical protein V6N13_054392 [Hibiscus sabdariffa]|uniref:Jacalin-type lectin domain-containing protein n=1 Tax=Hibiscus sabdariffa TaxID=183260 RepID=A0ABR2E1B9_9ROSI